MTAIISTDYNAAIGALPASWVIVCIKHLDVLTLDDITTTTAFLQKQLFEMLRAVDFVIVEMKINTLANFVITNTANEAFKMKLLLEGFENLTFNFLPALGTDFGEEFIEMDLTVWLVVMLMKLVPFKRLAAFRTNEVIRVPRLTEGRNVLSFDNLIAMTATRVEFGVVVIFTIKFVVFFDEGFPSKRLVARHTSEAIGVERLILGNDEGGINFSSTSEANLAATTATTTTATASASFCRGSELLDGLGNFWLRFRFRHRFRLRLGNVRFGFRFDRDRFRKNFSLTWSIRLFYIVGWEPTRRTSFSFPC